jgi:alkylation response protein AidB-like acyl-CoA dehydrogenase
MAQQGRWIDIIHEIGPGFAAQLAENEAADTFVAKNYAVLKERKIFSALVPTELGGGGASYNEITDLLRELARYDSSTALALSMHTHQVAAQRYGWMNGRPGTLLEKIAANEMVMGSSGAADLLTSSGKIEKVDGGFRVHARKPFASGAPAAEVLATSAPYQDPKEGWQILHFLLPLKHENVRIEQDWKAMGMRATGSNTVVIDGFFVPDASIVLRRPRGQFHPALGIAFGVAMPIIMAVYAGIAAAAADFVRAKGKGKKDELLHQSMGEVLNAATTARLAHDSMVASVNNFDFKPGIEHLSQIFVRKTIVARACLDACGKAMEAFGGRAYYRSVGIERLIRDAYAGLFHVLPEKKQHMFCGRLELGLDPVGEPRWED